MELSQLEDVRIVGRCCYCFRTIYLFHHRYEMHYITEAQTIPLCFSLTHCFDHGRVEGRKVYYCSSLCWQRRPLEEVMAQSRMELENEAPPSLWRQNLSRLIVQRQWFHGQRLFQCPQWLRSLISRFHW